MADVIIVGAGVIGASTAFHLAERDSDVLILDWDGPSAGSTARSAALVRAHYPTALEADLAWEPQSCGVGQTLTNMGPRLL